MDQPGIDAVIGAAGSRRADVDAGLYPRRSKRIGHDITGPHTLRHTFATRLVPSAIWPISRVPEKGWHTE